MKKHRNFFVLLTYYIQFLCVLVFYGPYYDANFITWGKGLAIERRAGRGCYHSAAFYKPAPPACLTACYCARIVTRVYTGPVWRVIPGAYFDFKEWGEK